MVGTGEHGHDRRCFARLRARVGRSAPGGASAGERGWRKTQVDQSGETLVETLCTLAIISLAIIALVTAMGYDFAWGRESRASAIGDTLLVSFSQNLETLTYESCTGSNTPYSTTASTALPTSLSGITVINSGTPSGPNQYLAKITSVQYWNGSTSPIGWSSSCPASGDPGTQLLTISVTPGDGATTRTMSFVKRSP